MTALLDRPGRLAALVAFASWFVALTGVAQTDVAAPTPPASPTSPLEVTAAPLLGQGAQAHTGWFGYVVQLHNRSPRPRAGSLRVQAQSPSWLGGAPPDADALVRTTFALEPGQSATFELPLHGYPGHAVDVVALDDERRELGRGNAYHSASGEALLVDLTQPSRIAKALTHRDLSMAFSGPSGPSGLPQPAQTFTISTPVTDARTGALLLPTHAAAYGGATLVLAESETLASLPDPELIALAGWVLAGGTLAVSVTRPEDLHGRILERFCGGAPSQTAVASSIETTALALVPGEGSTLGGAAPNVEIVTAGERVVRALVGFTGANLSPTRFGAKATYGLGEVHLLGFSPNRDPFLGNPWVEVKLTELLAHALTRRAHVVSPFGVQDPGDWRVEQVRRSLDPNVGNHWVIVTSAVVLVLYAIIAGPINFRLGRKAGKPLSALRRLPVMALGTFIAILGLGWLSKGAHSRARHLTLVEAGAGMSRGSAVRFRAFYGSSTEELRVGPTERGNVMDVVAQTDASGHSLHVARDGLWLDGFSAVPWQTVVVREDGFIRLGDGIVLAPAGDDVVIENKTGRGLAAVVLRRPDGRVFFHREIGDQAQVLASDGQAIPSARFASGSSAHTPPTALQSWAFQDELDAAAPGLSAALEAWNAMTESNTWWPSDVPALLAQWVGGEGKLDDSGYVIDSDRVVLRVIGFGGTP